MLEELSTYALSASCAKDMSGKLHYSKNATIKRARKGTVIFDILTLLSLAGLIFAFVGKSRNLLSIAVIGLICFGFMSFLSFGHQKESDYEITVSDFKTENCELHVKYKGKDVDMGITMDKEGKFLFADQNNKLDHIQYTDGTKLSYLNKYRIMNYVIPVLNSNDIFPSQNTVSFE